jgi:HD-GYP domain-containing protein (c-di-GMP phosphodiesterase class II)
MVTASQTLRPPSVTGVKPRRSEVLAALARVLDYSPRTEVPHHARVAILAARVAAHMADADPRDTLYAALVHDIGMPPADGEPLHGWSLEQQANHPLVRAHPLVGAQMVATVPELFNVAQIILDHHEWVNGHGYPRGRNRDEISPAAQAVRFADTCDMLLREQSSPELVTFIHAVLRRVAGQVDAPVADAGLEVLGEPHLYAQLLCREDVELLVEGAAHRYAAGDLMTTEAEVTGILEIFGSLADGRPSDKIGHSRRVADLAVLVSMAMGLDNEELLRVKWAALVHDIGLVAVPKSLLDKPGMLTQEELASVRSRIGLVEEFIRPIQSLEDVAQVAACHREAYDGSGYPGVLSGDKIPIGSRVLAVCDTFDALTSPRPYREARDVSLAVDILVKGSGSAFDPDVVAAAVPVILIAHSAEESPRHSV